MKIIVPFFLALTSLSFERSFFGFETIDVYFNKNKIGHWGVNTKTPEKIIVDFKTSTDTLCFYGYSDCGALDGTIIKIKYNDSLVVKLTRISKSGILRHDTLVVNPKPGQKQTFALDHGVAFYATQATFKNLNRTKVYSVFIQRIIDKNAMETNIFNLQLK